MSSRYSFSLANNFIGGALNEEQLQYEIQANSQFAGIAILDIGRSGDDVRIILDTTLSGPQQTMLNSIVAAHIAIQTTTKILVCVNPKSSKYNNTSYTRCGSMVYDGKIKMPEISSFQIVSYMDDSVTNYSFRVLDLSHGTIIASGTFNNTAEANCVVSNISNLSYEKATLEFQVMKTGGTNGKFMYIDSITVYSN